MSPATTIAIDGPAASGKTTLGIRLANALAYLFFDTGIMYRAITWAAINRGLDLSDEAAVTRLAETADIDVQPPTVRDERNADILVDGQDVTWDIRDPEVDANVSVVAAYPGVRKALMVQQRRIGHRGRVVMVGRDIGTVVLPDADLKIYLDASVEERARRRYEELCARGEDVDLAEILRDMRKRDRLDSTRSVAPLRPADDAVIINSNGMSIEQVVERTRELALQ